MVRSLVLLVVLSVMSFGFAQEKSVALDEIHSFQTFLRDAQIAKGMYGEGGLVFDNYQYGSGFKLGVQGGYPVTPQIEVGGAFGFRSFNADQGGSSSGITDITLSGRYNVVPAPAKISAGGYVTLPVGNDKIGEGHLNFGAFCSARYPLSNGMVVFGTAGLDFQETETVEVTFDPVTHQPITEKKTDYESSFLIGGGAIYPLNEQLNVIGELNIRTKGDYILLTGGGEFNLQPNSKIRGAIGLGLDDGAPDFSIMASFLQYFR